MDFIKDFERCIKKLLGSNNNQDRLESYIYILLQLLSISELQVAHEQLVGSVQVEIRIQKQFFLKNANSRVIEKMKNILVKELKYFILHDFYINKNKNECKKRYQSPFKFYWGLNNI